MLQEPFIEFLVETWLVSVSLKHLFNKQNKPCYRLPAGRLRHHHLACPKFSYMDKCPVGYTSELCLKTLKLRIKTCSTMELWCRSSTWRSKPPPRSGTKQGSRWHLSISPYTAHHVSLCINNETYIGWANIISSDCPTATELASCI
jgi:hypothetical protein